MPVPLGIALANQIGIDPRVAAIVVRPALLLAACGSEVWVFEQADGGSGASAGTGGYEWQYDQVPNPAVIELCPDTCAIVQADPAARVELMLGCAGS